MITHAVKLAAGVALAAGLGAPAIAASIVWQAPVTVSAPSDVLASGVLHGAITANNAGVTVGGVAFAGYAQAPTRIQAIGLYQASGAGAPNLADANYNQLLNATAFLDGGAPNAIRILGLTAGNSYAVQIWQPFWDANWETSYVAGNASAPVQAAGGVDVGTGTPSRPQYVIGSFVADASDQYISLAGTTTYVMFSAIQVRDVAGAAVPEPASWAMLIAGFGLTGAAMRRRRSSAQAWDVDPGKP